MIEITNKMIQQVFMAKNKRSFQQSINKLFAMTFETTLLYITKQSWRIFTPILLSYFANDTDIQLES